MADRTLDTKGLACPLPILKTRKAISELPIGATLEVTGTLSVTLDAHPDGPALSVAGDARLDSASELVVAVSGRAGNGAVLPVLSARRVHGTFGSVSVSTSGYSAVAVYGRGGVAVRVTAA